MKNNKNKRDFLDDLIDIRNDIHAVQAPLNDITQSLVSEDPSAMVWNPDAYKERPYANVVSCLSCQAQDPSACHACVDVCPVEAIDLDTSSIKVSDACRRCGLCVASCPSEAFVTQKLSVKTLYRQIAKIAVAYEKCYITCTRSLKQKPLDNMIVLPCIAAIPAELWYALMCEYRNICVYLPCGICEKCRTTTGEKTYTQAIAQAETWSGYALDVAVDFSELNTSKRRDWERKTFINDVVRSGMRWLAPNSRLANIAQLVEAHLDEHDRRNRLVNTALEKRYGRMTAQQRYRILMQHRELFLATLELAPHTAKNIVLQEPVCDISACTLCGKCESVCPVHAIEFDQHNRFKVASAYCINCGACAKVCPENALDMYEFSANKLLLTLETQVEKEKRAQELADEQENKQA